MNAIYRIDGNIAHTSETAGGPWDPKLQHGAAPSSLICWAVERLPTPVPMRVARITVDLMRPVPVAPLARALAVVEGVVGITVLGMLIASWTKKIMYR